MQSIFVYQGLGRMDMKRIDGDQFVLVFGRCVKQCEDIDDQVVCIPNKLVKEIANVSECDLAKRERIDFISQNSYDLVMIDIYPDIGYIKIATSDDKGATFKDYVAPMNSFLSMFQHYAEYIKD